MSEASEEWTVQKLSSFLDEQSLFCDGDWVESKDQDDEGDNRLIQLADIGDGEFLDKSNRFMNDEQFERLRCTALKEGDILIARMPDPIGRACRFPKSAMRCATVVDVAILRSPSNHTDASWLCYAINSASIRRQIEIKSAGSTRTRISSSNLKDLEFDTPPPPHQKKIATILETVDEAIEATEALIGKYEQVKAGMMQDLFTRGLTPDGKLRPPRDEAPDLYQNTPIGWIPKDWEVKCASELCLNIIDCKNRTPPVTESGFPVIRTSNVRAGQFTDVGLNFTDEESYKIWTARGRPIVGDIVITREAPVGEVCAIPERHPNACLGQRMMLYRTDSERVSNLYFLFVLQSEPVKNYLELISGGSTVGHVKVGEIRELPLPKPISLDEQTAIAVLIERQVEYIDQLRLDLQKLRQQKAGLMADLLTGKVPVTV